MLFSDNPIDFHDKTLDVLVKNLKYFLHKKYIKCFCNVLEEKYLVPLKVLYRFIKSFVNPFVDIASTFFDKSFHSPKIHNKAICGLFFTKQLTVHHFRKRGRPMSGIQHDKNVQTRKQEKTNCCLEKSE